jgi:hypothetical protein
MACGGRSELDIPSPESTTDASVRDVRVDVTTIVDAASDHLAGDAAPVYLGQLTFYRDTTQDAGTPSTTGSFFDGQFFASAAKALGGCTASGWNECTLYECPTSGTPFGTLSAGTLTVDGPTAPASGASVQLGPQGYGAYYTTAFEDGDVFGVSASGAEVAAFTEEHVTIPSMIDLTSPSSPYSIPTTQALIVTWTGGESNARVFFELDEYVTTKNDTTFSAICYFDAQSGSGVMPQGVLQAFQGYGGGYLVWGHQRQVVFTLGSYPLALVGMQYAYHPASFE